MRLKEVERETEGWMKKEREGGTARWKESRSFQSSIVPIVGTEPDSSLELKGHPSQRWESRYMGQHSSLRPGPTLTGSWTRRQRQKLNPGHVTCDAGVLGPGRNTCPHSHTFVRTMFLRSEYR